MLVAGYMGRNDRRNLFADLNFDSGYFIDQLENGSQYLKSIFNLVAYDINQITLYLLGKSLKFAG